jgi:hypothetical protein
MGKRDLPNDPLNSSEFDKWLKANGILGSALAVGILAMALSGLYSAGPANTATEFSSITARK